MTHDPSGPYLFQAEEATAQDRLADARSIYRAIAETGDARAWAPLGDLESSDPNGDAASAIESYRNGADAGDAIALYRLGQSYEHGIGTAPDPTAALSSYDRASELGLAPAATAAGRLVPNTDAARERWERAVELGDEPEALLGLAEAARTSGDHVAAVGCAIRAAYVARRLVFEPGVTPYSPVDLSLSNEVLARQLEAAINLVDECRAAVSTAAEAGDPTASWHWGRIQQLGFGEPPDQTEGRRFIERAAEAGLADAAYALAAEARDSGDIDRFEQLLRAAAGADHGAALHDLGYGLYAGAFGADPDISAACDAYRAAAALDRPVSATDLSFVLEDVASDDAADESVRWLRIAAEAGHVPAIRRLGERLRDGDGLDRDPGEALTWFLRAYYRGWEDGLVELGPLVDELEPGTVIDADRAADGSGLAAAILLDDDDTDDIDDGSDLF